MMQRWWHKRGPEATIDELQRSLEVVNMAYVTDEIDDKRRSELTSMHFDDNNEFDNVIDEEDANPYAEINDFSPHDAKIRASPVSPSYQANDHQRDDISETSTQQDLLQFIPHPHAGFDSPLTVMPPLPPVPQTAPYFAIHPPEGLS